jgi:serine/threonine protein kinase
VLKDICAELIRAMDEMHRKGLCHGDFRPSNILFRTDRAIDDLTDEEMLQLLGGKPEVIPVNQCIAEHGANGAVF